jgi:hypothetical protein
VKSDVKRGPRLFKSGVGKTLDSKVHDAKRKEEGLSVVVVARTFSRQPNREAFFK